MKKINVWEERSEQGKPETRKLTGTDRPDHTFEFTLVPRDGVELSAALDRAAELGEEFGQEHSSKWPLPSGEAVKLNPTLIKACCLAECLQLREDEAGNAVPYYDFNELVAIAKKFTGVYMQLNRWATTLIPQELKRQGNLPRAGTETSSESPLTE